MLSFQDKIRPVSSSQKSELSFADKIRQKQTTHKSLLADKVMQSDTTGASSAFFPAQPVNDKSYFSPLEVGKIIPNAVSDTLNLIKQGTYGTAKTILYDIPQAVGGLQQESQSQDLLTPYAKSKLTVQQRKTLNQNENAPSVTTQGFTTFLESLPSGTKDVVSSLVPNSAKNLMNVEALQHIPQEFQNLAKESGGYMNAFINAANSIPESVAPGLAQYVDKLDQARQSFQNHPVNELLGYYGLKQLVENPKQFAQQTSDALMKTKEFVTSPKQSLIGIGQDVKGRFTVTPEQQTRAINQLEQDYSRWTRQTKTGMNRDYVAEIKAEAKNRGGTIGKTPQRVLAETKIIPDIEGTKFNTAQQAQDLRDSVQPFQRANMQALKEVEQITPPLSIDDLQKDALTRVRNLKIPSGNKVSLMNDVEEEYSLWKQEYGDTIKLTDLNDKKQTYWGAESKRFDANKPFRTDAYYQIGKSAQHAIERTAAQAGNKEVAQLNRDIGDKLEAANYLESLNGQTLKFGKIGKYVFMTIGSTLGKTLVGKVLGVLGGEALGDFLMKNDVSSVMKRRVLNSIQETSPEAYQATLQWIKQQGIDRQFRLTLPPGNNQPIINQGRAIPVMPTGSKATYVGSEIVAQSRKLNPPK